MKLRFLSRTFCAITLCSPLLAGLSGWLSTGSALWGSSTCASPAHVMASLSLCKGAPCSPTCSDRIEARCHPGVAAHAISQGASRCRCHVPSARRW